MAPHTSHIGQTTDELLDHPRFADTRLASDPDHLAPAPACAIPSTVQARELLFPPNEGSRLASVICGNGSQPERPIGRAIHCSDEPVASSGDCFDEARLAGIVVEQGSKLADDGLQHCIAHELVAPDLVQQCILAEQRPRLAR